MSEDHIPKISVVMSVYNAQDDVAAAVQSILDQSFSDFEFIIIDDGSTDGTATLLEQFAKKDRRIRIFTQENKGLTRALNFGLSKARGVYIARQDADDFSYPQRFAQQVKILDNVADVVLTGSNADDVYADGFQAEWGFHEPEALQKIVYFKTPFPHSSVMMRRETVHVLGGYDESYRTAQDMELWMRMARKGRLAMVSDPLIRRNIGENAISSKRKFRQFYDATRARLTHNRGPAKITGLYHGLRSLLIASLPYSVLKFWRKRKRTTA